MVGGGGQWCQGFLRGLLLRGMPSANQLTRGKEGLNEANDPAAITAERSALNIERSSLEQMERGAR